MTDPNMTDSLDSFDNIVLAMVWQAPGGEILGMSVPFGTDAKAVWAERVEQKWVALPRERWPYQT